MEKAKPFPSLTNGEIVTLDGDVIPNNLLEYVTRNNRSQDELAQCTLLTVSFNDYGYKMLPAWTESFAKDLLQQHRTGGRSQIVRLVINEGRIISYFKNLVRRSFQNQNSPSSEYDSTLLFFGPKCPLSFRDVVRMHNTMTAYVFLLDGVGNVRWAGSGTPEDEQEVQNLLQLAKDLTPTNNTPHSRKGHRNSNYSK